MKAYRVVYLGTDGGVALALENDLNELSFPFLRTTADSEGVRKALEFRPDIVLWDFDTAGPEEPFPAASLRQAGFTRQPIVSVIRSENVQGAINSLAGGASDFLYKPVNEHPLPRMLGALNLGHAQQRADWANRVIDDNHEQVRAIISTLRDPAYIVSDQFQILWINRAAEEIFGEGQRGGSCHNVFYERPEPCAVCQKNESPARWRATLKNGKSYRFISAFIRNSKGEMERLVVGTDITPDEEVQKIHKSFISNVTHDLRTPLAAIQQYVSILLEGLAGGLTEEQAEYIGVIRKSTFRLNNLIENLIDANRILSNEFKLRMEVASIQEVAGLVAETLRTQAEEKGLGFSIQVPEDLPPVYADKQRIAQVLANIVGNSIKYTDQGMIQVRAGFMPRDEGRIIVSIEDTGIGVPIEDLGKIFELFYRVDNDKVFVEEGAGLGLSVSREIIRVHGGTLWAESIENMGSAFHFSLPIHAPA